MMANKQPPLAYYVVTDDYETYWHFSAVSGVHLGISRNWGRDGDWWVWQKTNTPYQEHWSTSRARTICDTLAHMIKLAEHLNATAERGCEPMGVPSEWLLADNAA